MGNKNCVHILVGNLMEGNSLGDLDVNGQLVLKHYEDVNWRGFCECDDPQGSIT
jgi:hypothetical protein